MASTAAAVELTFHELLARLAHLHDSATAQCKRLSADNARLCCKADRESGSALLHACAPNPVFNTDSEMDPPFYLSFSEQFRSEQAPEVPGPNLSPSRRQGKRSVQPYEQPEEATRGIMSNATFVAQRTGNPQVMTMRPSSSTGRSCSMFNTWSSTEGGILDEGATKELQDQLVLAMEYASLVEANTSRSTKAGKSFEDLGTRWTHLHSEALHPQGSFILFWSFCGIWVLSYEMIVMPLSFFWQSAEVMTPFDIVATIFWTLEIAVYMRTGYVSEGKLVTDPWFTCKKYMRTWFIVDILVVLPEWLAMITLWGSSNSSSLLKVVRMPRMLRIARLARLVKIMRLNSVFGSRIDSMHLLMGMRVSRWLGGIAVLMHIIACVWCWIGCRTGGWASRDFGRDCEDSESLTGLYLAAASWTLSHLGASTDIRPSSLLEQVYALLVTLVCTVLVVLFTSLTTVMLNRSKKNRMQYYDKALREFVKTHQVSYTLKKHMWSIMEDAVALRERERYDKDILELMPEFVSKDVAMQVWGSHLARQSQLFELLRNHHNCIGFFKDICFKAVKASYWDSGEVVFQPDDACSVARCRTHGAFTYLLAGQSPGQETMVRQKGGLISEACLWVSMWIHRGQLQAHTYSADVCIDTKDLRGRAPDYPEAFYVLRLYAGKCNQFINKNAVSPLSVVSDLPFPPDLWSRLWEGDDPFADLEEQHIDMHSREESPLPFVDRLPPHINPHVCHACVRMAQRVATDGLPEKQPHHGFTIIVGDIDALHKCGQSSFNPLKGHRVRVIDASGQMDESTFGILHRHAFHADGALVVDSREGFVEAAGWFVGDISKGGSEGGARSKSAKAIAQQAGTCFVVKASEDSKGSLLLHLGDKTQKLDSPLMRLGELSL